MRKVAAVTGRDLRNARPSLDENNQPAVSFTLSTEGGRKFGKVTGENIGRQLAIILDGRVQSAPRIDSRITTDGRITGSFTQEEVQNLSLILRSGALPARLDYLEEQTIGPSLGADSIRSGVIASVVGLLLVIVFMLVYYKLSGVNAVVALVFNLVILLGLMAYIGAVMTLPGIAGFVLTMGIGVDSNVLIFERIKEELEARARRPRVDQRRLQPRVLDAGRHPRRGAHLGGVPVPVRHRADSRLRGDAGHRSGVESVHVDFRVEDAVRAGAVAAPPGRDAVDLAMHIFKDTHFDFLRWRWHAIVAVVGHHHRRRRRRSRPRGFRRASSSPAAPWSSSSSSSRSSVQQVRDGARPELPGRRPERRRPGVRRPGAHQVMVRVPQRRRRIGHVAQPDEGRRSSTALQKGNIGDVQRGGHRDRRPDGRRRS